MKCPYCDSEMEGGGIIASRGAYWVSRARGVFLFPRKSKGDIVITGMWAGSSSGDAYLCRSCKKIVVDVKYNMQ